METSSGKNFKSFMAKMYLLVFESKNCIGSISKCLHLWKRFYHKILFSLEQPKETIRTLGIQRWKTGIAALSVLFGTQETIHVLALDFS